MASGLGQGSVRAGEDDSSRSMGVVRERAAACLGRDWGLLLKSKTEETGVVGEGVIE
jgi:hypothetical protein